MIRYCVICGKPFKAPPSDKKVTCSPACRSVRAANAARTSKRSWSPEARQRRRDDPAVKAHMGEIQSAGAEAALSLPEGQRGPQNRGSKIHGILHTKIKLIRGHFIFSFSPS